MVLVLFIDFFVIFFLESVKVSEESNEINGGEVSVFSFGDLDFLRRDSSPLAYLPLELSLSAELVEKLDLTLSNSSLAELPKNFIHL